MPTPADASLDTIAGAGGATPRMPPAELLRGSSSFFSRVLRRAAATLPSPGAAGTVAFVRVLSGPSGARGLNLLAMPVPSLASRGTPSSLVMPVAFPACALPVAARPISMLELVIAGGPKESARRWVLGSRRRSRSEPPRLLVCVFALAFRDPAARRLVGLPVLLAAARALCVRSFLPSATVVRGAACSGSCAMPSVVAAVVAAVTWPPN